MPTYFQFGLNQNYINTDTYLWNMNKYFLEFHNDWSVTIWWYSLCICILREEAKWQTHKCSLQSHAEAYSNTRCDKPHLTLWSRFTVLNNRVCQIMLPYSMSNNLKFWIQETIGKIRLPYLYFREDKGAVTGFELGLQSVQAEDLPAVKQHPFGQLTYQEINN